MKRHIYKLSFSPKIPIPHATIDIASLYKEKKENTFKYDGSFFLVSESRLILTDFDISDSSDFKGTFVHVSHPFEAFLSESDWDNIIYIHDNFSQYLASNMKYAFYNDYKVYLIPVMKIHDNPEWDSTLEWIKNFVDPKTISNIYQEVLIRFDRKNQGEKLGAYFSKNGDKVNRFIRFIMSLDIPIKKFVEQSQIQNDKVIEKPELVSLFSSLKFQELLIGRIIEKKSSRSNRNPEKKYSIVRSVAFDYNITVLRKSKNKYLKYLEHDDLSVFKPNIPLLDVVDIDLSNSYYSELVDGHSATSVSQSHQRILEILENRDLIPDVCQRIPDDYNPPKPVNLCLMENSYLIPISLAHLSIAHLFNPISEQFIPVMKGHLSINHAIKKAAELIKDKLFYSFRDLRLLRQALTDTMPSSFNRKALPTNSRLFLLGSAVVNYLATNIIFLANRNESVHHMIKMRSIILGGEFFRAVVEKINLANFYISKNGGPTAKLPSHTAQKVIYSLFGAIFLDSNLSCAFQAFKCMVMTDHKSMAESIFNLSPIGPQTLDYITKMNIESSSNSNSNQIGNVSFLPDSNLISEFSENPNRQIQYQTIYDAIGFSILTDFVPLFQAAFTHSSLSRNYTTNERLSFVGESFFKLVISMLSYRCFPTVNSDTLEYIIYEKMHQLPFIAYEKKISTATMVQSGFEDKLSEPAFNENDINWITTSLHSETLFAVVAAISFACGTNSAYEFVYQDVLGVNLFADINISSYKQKDLEEAIREKSGYTPLYIHYLVDGNYYTFMSLGPYRVQCVGLAKDPILSKQDLINSIAREFKENPSLILSQKEYEDIEMIEQSEEFPRLQYNTFDS